jgi:hypothetical protein
MATSTSLILGKLGQKVSADAQEGFAEPTPNLAVPRLTPNTKDMSQALIEALKYQYSNQLKITD